MLVAADSSSGDAFLLSHVGQKRAPGPGASYGIGTWFLGDCLGTGLQNGILTER